MSNEPEVIIYTDGACSGNPGPGGWAAILKHPATGAEKTLSGAEPGTTNNRMEMLAAIEGLRALKTDSRQRVRLGEIEQGKLEFVEVGVNLPQFFIRRFLIELRIDINAARQ